MVDINIVLSILPVFLANLRKHPQLSIYFFHIDEGNYSRMMSCILSHALTTESRCNVCSLQELVKNHSCLHVASHVYDIFLEVFRETLESISGIDRTQADTIYNRLKHMCHEIQTLIHSPGSSKERLSLIVNEVKTSNDLNAMREGLISDLIRVEEMLD